jgi:hypothetical protein
MECNKWQEVGLLCVSKEMDAEGNIEFKRHVEQCPSCKAEADQYDYEKKNFFLDSALCESPSEAIDNKIIAACSRAPEISTSLGIFSGLWVKKALVSTVFLIFGMSAGVYFTVNYFNTGNSNAVASSSVKKPEAIQSSIVQDRISIAKVSDSSRLNKKDSLKRSAPEPLVNQQQRRGSQEGIITVDLKKE